MLQMEKHVAKINLILIFSPIAELDPKHRYKVVHNLNRDQVAETWLTQHKALLLKRQFVYRHLFYQ